MIDKLIFSDEIDGLSEYFGKTISEKQQGRLYLILNAELTTDEFKQAIILAYRNCKFFPTPAELIESVHGTIEDRAIRQWDNIAQLSPVGKDAFDSVGGDWARRHSEGNILRAQFIKAFKAYAVGVAPDRLRIPERLPAMPETPRQVLGEPTYKALDEKSRVAMIEALREKIKSVRVDNG
jgi:hypothetical protein